MSSFSIAKNGPAKQGIAVEIVQEFPAIVNRNEKIFLIILKFMGSYKNYFDFSAF